MSAPPAGSPLLLGQGWSPDQAGGLNRYFRALLEALHHAGAAPRAVVLGPAAQVPPDTVVAAASTDPLPVRLLRFWLAGGRAARGAGVLDSHFALYAFLPSLIGPGRRLPQVVHFHGPWAAESRHAGYGASQLRLMAKRWMEGAVYRRADALVVLSEAFKRTLVQGYGVDADRVRVIPPGIDLAGFAPGDPIAARRRLGWPEDAFVAFTVRRLVPRMGLDVLMDAWARIVHDAGGGHRMLIIAGDGSEEPALRARAQGLGLGEAVHFAGRIDDPTLIAHYQAADVVPVPSLDLEGFGLVVLEALACGTPVLVTDAGGLPETVGDFDQSLIVPAGDASALAERLGGAISGACPLPPRGACRQHAERFSWQEAARRHGELFASLAR